MSRSRSSAAVPILIAALILLAAPLAAYVTGYYWLGDRTTQRRGGVLIIARGYRYEWLSDLYRPAALVEYKSQGPTVFACTHWTQGPHPFE